MHCTQASASGNSLNPNEYISTSNSGNNGSLAFHLYLQQQLCFAAPITYTGA